MSPSLLGTTLDGEVVLLEMEQARLFHLDPWAREVWSACDGRDPAALAAAIGAPADRVRETLLTLADAGLILPQGAGWVRAPVTWV